MEESSSSSSSSSFFTDNVKTEKRNAMLRYRRLTKISTNLFRFFEVCLGLIFLSWFSTTRLSIAVQISGDYFRHLCVFIVSPRFVFLLGNAIILTLFAKSHSHHKPAGSSTTPADHHDLLYNNYLINTDHKVMIISSTTTEEDIVYEDKKEIITAAAVVPDAGHPVGGPVYRRSKSEKQTSSVRYPDQRELRRTETDLYSRNVEIPTTEDKEGGSVAEKKMKKALADDQEMSNEEFQRKIEDFIAKQMRFHREESMAIVLNQNNNTNAAVTTTSSVKIKV